MTRPFLLIDLGATLVHGPKQGPAGRIAAALGLSRTQRAELDAAIMTRAWEGPGQVAGFVRAELGIEDRRTDEAVADVWTAQECEAQAIDGAEAALETLFDAGFRIGVISNIWRPYLTAILTHFGRLFDRCIPPENRIYSFREGAAKPAAQLFRRALAAARAEPGDAIMIGDSYREDIEPAARLGLRTVWLLHRPAKEADGIARILNGAAPHPSWTLLSIADLTPDLLADLPRAAPREKPLEMLAAVTTRCA
jgi:FMN phosphatase YigB (HAD superfamily)